MTDDMIRPCDVGTALTGDGEPHMDSIWPFGAYLGATVGMDHHVVPLVGAYLAGRAAAVSGVGPAGRFAAGRAGRIDSFSWGVLAAAMAVLMGAMEDRVPADRIIARGCR